MTLIKKTQPLLSQKKTVLHSINLKIQETTINNNIIEFVFNDIFTF